jgi:hypothetical protein
MSRRGKANRRSSIPRQERGPRRGRGGAPRLKWLVLCALLAVCGSLVAVGAFLALGAGSGGQSAPPKAAIIDQLSLTYPNPSFREQATALLQQAGYEVDYFPGEEVTVDFLRNLASQRYRYLILRVHSTVELHEASGAVSTDEMFLFTGEPYSRTKYADERLAGYLVRTHYSEDDPRYYYGIAPSFIESKMKGSFDGATVILMGCDSLASDTAARAFVDKGAKAVIGWTGGVSADYTDAATERLLHYLLVDNQTPSGAVAQTMAEVGPEPSSGSELVLYPAEAAASAGN